MNETEQVAVARRIVGHLWDQMERKAFMDADAWSSYVGQLNRAAGDCWTLITGSRNNPSNIEFCLPKDHVDYKAPKEES